MVHRLDGLGLLVTRLVGFAVALSHGTLVKVMKVIQVAETQTFDLVVLLPVWATRWWWGVGSGESQALTLMMTTQSTVAAVSRERRNTRGGVL
jgi:hypothetical protein